MKRLFIALPLSDQVRRAAAELIRRLAPGRDVRWVDEDNLHVTLSFLGSTPEVRVPALVARMREAARRPAFEVGLGAVESRARVIWVKVEEGAVELAAIAGALPQLERRQFRPHLTLGRPRSRAKVSAPALGLRQRAERLVLYESRVTSKGPIYTAVEAVPIGL